MKKIPSYIIDFLMGHGFQQEELKGKSDEEILNIYQEGIAKFVQNFLPQDKQIIVQAKLINPFEALRTPTEIYEMNLDFFLEIPLYEIANLIQKRFVQIPLEKAQRIVSVLGYCFQEELLEKIGEQISHLPPQEQLDIIEIYQSQENNLANLITINTKLQSPHFREQLEQLIQIKNRIQELKGNSL